MPRAIKNILNCYVVDVSVRVVGTKALLLGIAAIVGFDHKNQSRVFIGFPLSVVVAWTPRGFSTIMLHVVAFSLVVNPNSRARCV